MKSIYEIITIEMCRTHRGDDMPFRDRLHDAIRDHLALKFKEVIDKTHGDSEAMARIGELWYKIMGGKL
jgi:hypothetical protein